MKNTNKMLLVTMISALIAFAFPAMAAPVVDVAGAVDPASTGSSIWNIALGITLPILVALSSIIANFFAVKDSDSPFMVFTKRLINTFALNLSRNAGK